MNARLCEGVEEGLPSTGPVLTASEHDDDGAIHDDDENRTFRARFVVGVAPEAPPWSVRPPAGFRAAPAGEDASRTAYTRRIPWASPMDQSSLSRHSDFRRRTSTHMLSERGREPSAMPQFAQFAYIKGTDTAFKATGNPLDFDLPGLMPTREVILMFKVSGKSGSQVKMSLGRAYFYNPGEFHTRLNFHRTTLLA